MKKDFNYLHHLSVEEWWIYFYVFQKCIQHNKGLAHNIDPTILYIPPEG